MTNILLSRLQLIQSTKIIESYFSTIFVKSACFSVAPVMLNQRLILLDKQFPNVRYVVRGKSLGLF